MGHRACSVCLQSIGSGGCGVSVWCVQGVFNLRLSRRCEPLKPPSFVGLVHDQQGFKEAFERKRASRAEEEDEISVLSDLERLAVCNKMPTFLMQSIFDQCYKLNLAERKHFAKFRFQVFGAAKVLVHFLCNSHLGLEETDRWAHWPELILPPWPYWFRVLHGPTCPRLKRRSTSDR